MPAVPQRFCTAVTALLASVRPLNSIVRPNMERRSVSDIEGSWVQPDFESGLIRRCRTNWSVPVCNLTNEALATFLRQKFALQIVLPEGERRLHAKFTDDTELFPEELANAVQIARDSLA